MSLALTDTAIDKYLKVLSRLDTDSKKKLIIRLTESIGEKSQKSMSLKELSGAWEDSRDSDEIIRDIKNSRVEKRDDGRVT